jgi:mannuronan synthase
MSAYMHSLALVAFVAALAWSMDVLPTPKPMLFLP